MTSTNPHIAFLGFGEAGQAFATGLRQDNPALRVSAFDIKTGAADTAAAKQADYDRLKVTGLRTAADLAGADVIFSVVTADQAATAASAVATASLRGVLFVDCNSCAPGTKRHACDAVTAAGGQYVDMAVMAPVYPSLHRVACLASGPDAAAAAGALNALGMAITAVDGPVGAACTRKMLRSVMVKGMEALTLECVLAARKAGVEDAVLASLQATFPGLDWAAQAPYNIERVTTHGLRRAAEMREVANTVAELGLPADMSRAVADWQQRVGELALPPGPDDLGRRADAVLGAMTTTGEERT